MLVKRSSIFVLLLALFLPESEADTLTFDFKDPRGVNNVGFQLDAPLESIKGSANGFSGTIMVDPANLVQAKGRIAVATKSLVVPNPLMRMHLLGKDWLNAKANPEISFEIRKVANVESEGKDISRVDVTGLLTLNGVSKELTVSAKLVHMPGKLRDVSKGKLQGDLLVVRSKFKIKRSDFNIRPGEVLDRVSDDIDLSLSIAGAALRTH
jgi:polyisoprenoid-binding protein YceI